MTLYYKTNAEYVDQDKQLNQRINDITSKQIALWGSREQPINANEQVLVEGEGAKIINDLISATMLQDQNISNIIDTLYDPLTVRIDADSKDQSVMHIVILYNNMMMIYGQIKRQQLKTVMEANMEKVQPYLSQLESDYYKVISYYNNTLETKLYQPNLPEPEFRRNVLEPFRPQMNENTGELRVPDSVSGFNSNMSDVEDVEEGREGVPIKIKNQEPATLQHLGHLSHTVKENCNFLMRLYSAYALVSAMRNNLTIKKYAPINLADVNLYFNSKIRNDFGSNTPQFLIVGSNDNRQDSKLFRDLIRKREAELGHPISESDRLQYYNQMIGKPFFRPIYNVQLSNYLESPKLQDNVYNNTVAPNEFYAEKANLKNNNPDPNYPSLPPHPRPPGNSSTSTSTNSSIPPNPPNTATTRSSRAGPVQPLMVVPRDQVYWNANSDNSGNSRNHPARRTRVRRETIQEEENLRRNMGTPMTADAEDLGLFF